MFFLCNPDFYVPKHYTLWWAKDQAHTATAELIQQHAAPPQPAASPAAPPAAGEPAARSPTSLPPEIYQSAGRGELRKVASWLRKGGLVDALGPASTEGGQTETFSACCMPPHATASWR